MLLDESASRGSAAFYLTTRPFVRVAKRKHYIAPEDIEDAEKLAAMPEDVFEGAFRAAIDANRGSWLPNDRFPSDHMALVVVFDADDGRRGGARGANHCGQRYSGPARWALTTQKRPTPWCSSSCWRSVRSRCHRRRRSSALHAFGETDGWRATNRARHSSRLDDAAQAPAGRTTCFRPSQAWLILRGRSHRRMQFRTRRNRRGSPSGNPDHLPSEKRRDPSLLSPPTRTSFPSNAQTNT